MKSGRIASLLGFFLLAPGVALALGDKTPTPPPSPVGVGGLLQIVLALAFVLGLILGLAWLLRRMGGVPQAAAGAMRVLGGVAIGQRERIVLVQVGETQLVVGVGPGQIRTLHVLDKPVAVPPTGGGPGGDFAQRLAAALHRGGKP
jgi:flagellar protein FliO/FliZ